jgi:glycerol-3-phosphate dehydrogenase
MTAAALCSTDRGETLDRLERERFDLVVIGGGISGAGVARAASQRGLRVALLEASDFASGGQWVDLVHPQGLRRLVQNLR